MGLMLMPSKTRNTYKFEYVSVINWHYTYLYPTVTDITDFVFKCDQIPINFERNANWQPIISEFNFNLSQTCSAVIPRKDDYVTFYINGIVKQIGMVEDVAFEYDTHSWKINARSPLKKLQERKFFWEDDLRHNLENKGGDLNLFNSYDNQSTDNRVVGNVNVPWFIANLCKGVGITVDITNVQNCVVAGWGGITYYVKDIILDWYSIFSVNQDNAMNPNTVLGHKQDYTPNLIMYWDLLSVICGYYGFVFVPTGFNAYKLVHQTQLAEVNVDSIAKYKYTNNNIAAKYNRKDIKNNYGYRWEYATVDDEVRPLTLPKAIVTPLIKITANTLNNPVINTYTVPWYTNIIFLYRGPSYGSVNASLGEFTCLDQDIMFNKDFSYGGIYGQNEDLAETDIITDAVNLIQNKVDITTERSIINKNKIVLWI